MHGGPFTLAPGASNRVSFAGINNGPVKIVSNDRYRGCRARDLQSQRVQTSFSEMMALPNSQLDNIYWMPWYNNVGLEYPAADWERQRYRPATVHVFIGGMEMAGSPFTLQPGAERPQELCRHR